MSGTANVTGKLPTTANSGATPVAPSDTASINIYRQTGTGAPVKVGQATISGADFSFQDAGLAAGTYNWGSTAVNADGVESAVSNLFPGIIPAAPPSAPLLDPPTIVNVAIS